MMDYSFKAQRRINASLMDGETMKVIDNEVNVPNDQSEARFNLEAFSDSFMGRLQSNS